MIATIELSKDQEIARDQVIERLRAGSKLVTFGGYAGTGKTTTTASIVNSLRSLGFKRIAFCCFTGKAYKVLESKLIGFGTLGFEDFCGTIHSLLYHPRTRLEEKKDGNKKLHIDFHSKEEKGEYDLIVIDEASMVNEEIYEELRTFNSPILAVGDHGQLPPVKGSFNLMQNPEIRLTKIHRQAEGDPIIRLSILAREEGQIPFGEHGEGCIKTNDESIVNAIENPKEWTLITGTNKKRVERNRWARWKLGYKGELPIVGDRVVCLRNDHSQKVFNGMVGTVTGIKPAVIDKDWNPACPQHWVWLDALMDAGNTFYGNIFRYQFGQPKPLMETIKEAPDLDPRDFGRLWDFGYALTCHKAQGSEADKVVVYEERAMWHVLQKTVGEQGWRRWLYTAVTRAKKQLIIVGE
jgi:exodeoxyribonuclease-5